MPAARSAGAMGSAVGWGALAVLVAVAWEAASRAWGGLIPQPAVVARYIASVGLDLVVRSLALTMARSALGFAIALAAALALTGAAHALPAIRPLVDAFNTWMQSVSALVWVIVFIVFFGITNPLPPVLVAAAVSFPILLSGLLGALEALERRYGELARAFRAPKHKELVHIIVPGLVPAMASSGRAALGVALRISVVAEALGASGGAGYMLMLSYDRSDIVGVFAWGLVLVLAMLVLDQGVLRPLEAWARRWLT